MESEDPDTYDNVMSIWRQVAMENLQKVEDACERSLTDPQRRGVLVTENQYGTILSAELSDRVPEGHVYIFRKEV